MVTTVVSEAFAQPACDAVTVKLTEPDILSFGLNV